MFDWPRKTQRGLRPQPKADGREKLKKAQKVSLARLCRCLLSFCLTACASLCFLWQSVHRTAGKHKPTCVSAVWKSSRHEKKSVVCSTRTGPVTTASFRDFLCFSWLATNRSRRWFHVCGALFVTQGTGQTDPAASHPSVLLSLQESLCCRE